MNSPGIAGSDDPLSLDPEFDAMQPAEAKIKEMMGQIADASGLPPDLAYAIRRTGLLVADRNKDFLDSAQTRSMERCYRRISNQNRLRRSPAHLDS